MSDPLIEDITLEAAKILLVAQREQITSLQSELADLKARDLRTDYEWTIRFLRDSIRNLRSLDDKRCLWCGGDRMGNDEICPKCQHAVSPIPQRG